MELISGRVGLDGAPSIVVSLCGGQVVGRRVRWFMGVRNRVWGRTLTFATAAVAAGAVVTQVAVAQPLPQYHYTGGIWSPSALAATKSVPVHPLKATAGKAELAKGQLPLAVYQAKAPVWPAAGVGTASLTSAATAASAAATAKSGRAAADSVVPVTAPVRAGALPVWVAPHTVAAHGTRVAATAAASGPSSVRVQVASHAQTLAAGADGLLLGFSRADGGTATGQVQAVIDYSSLAQAYGGGFASRLELVEVPACALTTPSAKACRTRTPLAFTNSPGTDQLTATVPLAAAASTVRAGASARSAAVAAAVTPMTAVEVISGTSGAEGNYAATSLDPAGGWSATGDGAFTYSYPIDVPTPPAGTAPGVSLAYNSQSVDGETSARNSQSSDVGDGWDYDPGFVERSYRSCGSLLNSDGSHVLKDSGDECWGGDDDTISFGSHSGVLVPTTMASNVPGLVAQWKLQGDDGTVVQELSGAENGLYQGIYFRVLTTDGTAAYFGSDHAPAGTSISSPPQSGTPTDSSTDSAWGVPVLHPVSGDPCYSSAQGTASKCAQNEGWRWNLDFTVSPTGFVQRYDYTSETNYYDLGGGQVTAPNGSGTLTSYTRGGTLAQISYGYTLADEQAGNTPAAAVVFGSTQRCQTSSTFTDCSAGNLNANTATNWPDVPYDLDCPSTDSTTIPSGSTTIPANVCINAGPSFWDTTRLSTITTKVDVAGSGLTPVDTYQLNQVFSDAGGSVDPVTGTSVDPKDAGSLQAVMWLQSITHTGDADSYDGGGTPLTMNQVTFTGTEIDNRVDGSSPPAPPLYHPRIATVATETGEDIAVTYYPPDCSRVNGTMPASADSDTMSCYQVYWSPPGAAKPIADWFNKIRVQSVASSDMTGAVTDTSGGTLYEGSPTEVTDYAYSGAAWHRDDSAQTDDQYRTWDQFRGYRTVTTTTGTAPDPVTQTVTTYLQGMDGDYLANGTQRSVSVNAVVGGTTTEGDATASPAVHGSPTQVGGTVVETVKDSNWLAGTPLETDTYTKASGIVDPTVTGGTIEAESIAVPPDTTQTASTPQTPWTDWNTTDDTGTAPTLSTLPPLTALRVTDSGSRDYALLKNGSWSENQTTTDYDSQARVSTVDTIAGVGSTAPQEQCTTTTYASPSATNAMMLSYADQVTTVSGGCAAPTPTTLFSDQQTYYGGDGSLANLGTFGQLDPPDTMGGGTGLVTGTRTATSDTSAGGETWQTTSAISYDGGGRVVKTLDTDGSPTSTSFKPAWNAAGGNTAATTVTSTNSQGWTTTSTLDPLRGLPTEDVDDNGGITDITYDALGRRTAVWLPGRSKASGQSADETFSYLVSNTSPSAVTTNTLREDGSYAQNITLYDGMLQPRQQQSTTADNSAGRLISDTFYDSHGWPVRSYAPYVDATTSPSTTLAIPDTENQIPSETVTAYDGLGRSVSSQLYTMGAPQWESTTSYPGADETDSTPPAGGPTTATIENALGQTTSTVVKNTNAQTTLTGGEIIPSGTSLMSDSVRLSMQAGGNLVLSSLASGKTLWSTGTSSAGSYAEFGTDGNLVVDSPTGAQQWSTALAATTGSTLKLQDDANLVDYSSAGATRWSSGTAGAAAEADSTTGYTYYPTGQLHTVTDTAGNQWSYTYNLLGEETSQTDPNAGTTTFDKYDADGDVLQSTDPRGQATSYTYDWDDRAVASYAAAWSATPSASTQLTSTVYDTLAKGYPTSETSYVGGSGSTGKAYTQTVTGYNVADQPLGETETIPASDGFAAPAGTKQGAAGTVTFESDNSYTPNTDELASTSYGHDGGLPAETVGYQYDLQGLMTESGSTLTSSTGATSSASYLDDTNYTPNGQELRSTYGLYGKQLVTTDAYDPATGRLSYSSTNTQTSTSNAIDGVSYRYDDSGNITAISDVQSNGSTVTGTDTQCFSYDSMQRLTQAWTDTAGINTSSTSPADPTVGDVGGCNTTTPETTATAPIKTTTVGDTAGDAYWQSYTYDLLGDRTSMVNHDTGGNALDDTTQTIGYNGADGTTPAAQPDQGSTTTISNPELGTTVETDTHTDTGYTPNENAGNTMSRKLSAGPLSTGLRNSAGLPVCASDPSASTTAGTAVTTYACSPGTGQTFTLGTDSTLKVAGMCLDTTGGAKTAGTVVEINTCNSATTTQKWQTGATGDTLVNTASGLCLTDPAGSTVNSTKLTIAACGVVGQSWTTTGATGGQAPGTSQNISYNAMGLTSAVTTTNGGNSQTSSYTYDAEGNLLEQANTFDNTKILYLFGGTEQITLNVPNNSVTALRNYAGPDGTTVTRSSAGTLTYQLSNLQGTATTAVDATSLAVTRRAYDPFGNARGTVPSTFVGPSENHGFLGQPTDTSSGLDLLGARNYDPTQGRFLSLDPVFEAGDPNQMGGYTYAADNPSTGSDPDGRMFSDDGGGGGGDSSPSPGLTPPPDPSPQSNPDPTATPDPSPEPPDHYDPNCHDCSYHTGLLWALNIASWFLFPEEDAAVDGARLLAEEAAKEAAERAAKKAAEEAAKKAAEEAAEQAAKEAAKKAAEAEAASAAKKAAELAEKKAAAVAKAEAEEKAAAAAKAEASKASKIDPGADASDDPVTDDNPGGSGCHSFLPDTLVLMADGTVKEIKDVKPGDQVLATDPLTGESVTRPVTDLITTPEDDDFADLTIATKKGPAHLTATVTHPFWVVSYHAWIDAGHLKPGMALRTADGTATSVLAVRTFHHVYLTHDLTVATTHTFYVLAGTAAILVHNSNVKCPTDVALGAQDEGVVKWANKKGFTHYMGNMEDGRTWQEAVMSAISKPEITMRVYTKGFDGGFLASALRGMSGSERATEWEMSWLAKAVIEGERPWSSIVFYDAAGDELPMEDEPDWANDPALSKMWQRWGPFEP